MNKINIKSRDYSNYEEVTNALTHGFGILLGIVAAYFMLPKAYAMGNWTFYTVFVYFFGMLFSYISSTVYHSCRGWHEALLQKIDHTAIYFHIAGTYTPFTLLLLRNEGYWGWGLFIFVWLVAILGTIWSFRMSGKHSYLETICYVAMGCSILIAFKPLISVLQAQDRMEIIYWIIAGGVSYIVGAGFYSLIRVPYMHTLFHLFVLGGSVCHIIAINAILI